MTTSANSEKTNTHSMNENEVMETTYSTPIKKKLSYGIMSDSSETSTTEEEDDGAPIEHLPPNHKCQQSERCVSSCAAYGWICPCAARKAAKAACSSIQELLEGSKIFGNEHQQEEVGESSVQESACTKIRQRLQFTCLDRENDIKMGDKLGEGGFSHVNSCVITQPSHPHAGKPLAIKYLKKRAMVDAHQFKHGAADLAIEAFYLQALDHPNIVKLHGIAKGSVESNVACGKECSYFIVIDRVCKTLEKQIDEWREQRENEKPPMFHRLSSDYRQQKRAELMQRIRIALSIAEAMEYLHSQNIIFRDLKPDNIGFDKDGVLKIFDFGLAKELKENQKRKDGKYELTGNTGSRRYMCPEVARDLPYNKNVDVYSFGILLWEMCAAEKPFHGYSSVKHMHQVVLGGERPKMDNAHTQYWPANLQWLMKNCWSSVSCERPPFYVIKRVLLDILDGKCSINAAALSATPPPTYPTSRGSTKIITANDEVDIIMDNSSSNNHSRSNSSCSDEDLVLADPPSPGYFGALFPLSRRRARSTPEGSPSLPQLPGHPKKTPLKTYQCRSWGFLSPKR